MKKSILLLLISLLASNQAFSQKTPQALGKAFFLAMKNNDTAAIDTLMAECAAVRQMYIEGGSTLEMLKSPDFCEKFDYRNARFIRKCAKMRADTTYYAIDWESAVITDIAYNNQNLMNTADSTVQSKGLDIHYLIISFSSNDTEYGIGLRGIKYLNDRWKLGTQIRLKPVRKEKE